MSETNQVEADLFLGPDVSMDDGYDLADALSAVGVTAHRKLVPVRRGPEQLQWAVLLALPLHAFLSDVGTRAAGDAYAGLKRAVRQLLDRPSTNPAGPSPIVLQDAGTGLRVIFTPDLTEAGYDKLFETDLTQFRMGPIHYDVAQGRWRSTPDEAAGAKG